MGLFINNLSKSIRIGPSQAMAAIYAAFFVGVGAYLPFIPVWLEQRGLDPGEIAIVLAAPLIVRTGLSPWLTFAIDSRFQRWQALAILNLTLVGLLCILPLVSSFLLLIVIFVAMGLCSGSTLPLSDASAISAARTEGRDYGRIRLWGSISFLITTIAGGSIIGVFGIDSTLVIIIAAHLSLVTIATLAPIPARTNDPSAMAPAVPGRSVFHVLSRPAFIGVLIIASLLQASHAVNYSFASLHWQRLGYSPLLIGTLWATGVVAEIILFAWSKTLLQATGPRRLLLIAASGAVLRWILLAIDPPLPVTFFAQALHCLSFALSYLAALTFISRTVSAELNATAQSMQYALSGALMAAATLASGPLFERFAAGAYFAMAAIGLVALAGLAVIRMLVPEVKDSAP